MLELVKGTLGSCQLAIPGPNVIIAENCQAIPVEMVLRKYMAKSTTKTSLYHHYVNLGKKEFCGHELPEGLKPNGILPFVMDTPSTKSDTGDESVSPLYLFNQKTISPQDYTLVNQACREAFNRGSEALNQKGIILVDTKFEVGRNQKGEIVFIDEVLTPDASRYWLAGDYEEKFARGEEPLSYSKQLARDIGQVGQPFTEEEVVLIACRYIESYQLLTGNRFIPDTRDIKTRIVSDIKRAISGFKFSWPEGNM